jgi:hypothetical protein
MVKLLGSAEFVVQKTKVWRCSEVVYYLNRREFGVISSEWLVGKVKEVLSAMCE